jgi:hypothetical protein
MNKLNIPVYRRRLFTANNNYILNSIDYLFDNDSYLNKKIRIINNTTYGIRINIIK